eukprot:scaffold1313_cov406-Prasinococcus_capsulatus_cf.AAC.5
MDMPPMMMMPMYFFSSTTWVSGGVACANGKHQGEGASSEILYAGRRIATCCSRRRAWTARGPSPPYSPTLARIGSWPITRLENRGAESSDWVTTAGSLVSWLPCAWQRTTWQCSSQCLTTFLCSSHSALVRRYSAPVTCVYSLSHGVGFGLYDMAMVSKARRRKLAQTHAIGTGQEPLLSHSEVANGMEDSSWALLAPNLRHCVLTRTRHVQAPVASSSAQLHVIIGRVNGPSLASVRGLHGPCSCSCQVVSSCLDGIGPCGGARSRRH